MSEDPRHDDLFLGRPEELFELVRNLQRGRHTLLLGPKGIGKSRLMIEAMNVLVGRVRHIELSPGLTGKIKKELVIRFSPNERRLLHVVHTSPLGDLLKEICEQLHSSGDLQLPASSQQVADCWQDTKKALTGMGSVKIQDLIISSLASSSRPYIIFLDNLDRIAPTHHQFLERLLGVTVICAAIVQINESVHFRKIWPSFSRIELGPLPESTCREIIRHYVRSCAIKVADPALYEREVLKAANGNPFHLKNFIWHGFRERHIAMGEIRKMGRLEEGEYFNMGPIYIFCISIFTLFKIFSLGTDNREFYIYFSSLGFLVYLAFRVFRNFFLFRPQRYK